MFDELLTRQPCLDPKCYGKVSHMTRGGDLVCYVCMIGPSLSHATVGFRVTYCGLPVGYFSAGDPRLKLPGLLGVRPDTCQVPQQTSCPECQWMLLNLHELPEVDWRPPFVIAEDSYAL